ncbi:MAG: glutathione S-transferase N-terminal domain-containing protein [Acetobacteraceae bacterium]
MPPPLPQPPVLFYSEGSPYARICRMALRERGLAGAVREVVTTLRDPAAPVLAHSPVGRVPALVLADGATLTETTLVLGWLDRMGSAPPMLPAEAAGVAAYGRVLGLLDGIAVWNRELRRPVHERSPSVLALEEARAGRVADALERHVGAGAFARVDAGYLTLAAVLGYAERRHTVWHWRKGRPALVRWFAVASVREAFRETMPPVSGI